MEDKKRVRLIVQLKVRQEDIHEQEPPKDLIARGVFLSWEDLFWWLREQAVRRLDVDD